MNRVLLSGCVIIEDGKLLVIWKIKHGHYELPGGKVDQGESWEETALRETKEELGCDIEILKYLGYKDFHIEEKDFRSHNYLAKIKEGQEPCVMEPDKFRDVLWLPMKDYMQYDVAQNVKAFCEEYIQGKLELQ